MIKIIKHENRHECTCERCGCIFSFEKEDTYIDYKDKQFIRCPECQNRIEVCLDE